MDFFLDSGAFSAFTKGVKIDIIEYCNFIKEHSDIITHYAVLDVIGSAEDTLKNQKIMESQGLSPVPCFHYGDDYSYLTYYINNYDYIALGGMVPIHTNDLIPWLDTVFAKFICNDDGTAKIRVHGFGLTTVNIMIRYPWYSVDSTTWRLASAFGEIFVPYLENNEYNYTKFRRIAVSEKNKKRISNKTTTEYIKKYLSYFKIPYGDEEHEGVSNNNNYRAWANLIFFDNLEKQINQENRVFNVIKKGLFE